MIQAAIVHILPIWYFLSGAWILFYQSKSTINSSLIENIDPQYKLIELHFTLRMIDGSINIYWVKQRISRLGEKKGKSHMTKYV